MKSFLRESNVPEAVTPDELPYAVVLVSIVEVCHLVMRPLSLKYIHSDEQFQFVLELTNLREGAGRIVALSCMSSF